MRRVARLDMANTPELRDHRIGHFLNDLQTTQRVARLGTANTPELQHHHIKIYHSTQNTNWILGKFKARDKRVWLCGTRGTHLSKVSSWAKHLTNDFTTQSEGAPVKTYPVSHKTSINQDKDTYTSGEQEQLIELSSFNMCSTVQS
jgi:hypothetical protein